jgi:hypothetical protein
MSPDELVEFLLPPGEEPGKAHSRVSETTRSPGTRETRGKRTRRDERPLGSHGSFLSGMPLPTNAFGCSRGVSI